MRERIAASWKQCRSWALGAGVVVALACGATAAIAESDRSLAEELIEIMHASGTIDQAQYRHLLEKARQEEHERAEGVRVAREAAEEVASVTAAAPDVSAGPEDWTFAWNNGFRLERNDAFYKFRFGGRIQNDWAVIGRDDALEDVFDQGTGTEFRRARIYFRGTMYEQFVFKAQYDFAGGESELKDAYLGLKGLGWLGEVRVGHTKEPFSIEQMDSSNDITFMERSLANVFVPVRNTGFALQNTLYDDRLLWQVGAYRNTDDEGDGFSDDGDYNITARLSAVLIYRDEGAKVLHLGAAYSHQFRGGDFTVRYRQRPEANLADRIVDTQAPSGLDIPTDGIDLLDVEAALVWGPASVQAEYIHSFVNGDQGAGNTDFWSSYLEAS